ncbi:PXA domain protein [Talaromyces proteolyticus]|uniref:PXA domain protein n=1 Tax=Talaromyces proteolyticus TaxID=1131652 RepID=A0AAD4PXL5_9EURO|nr:PXA domain protein [Talaromyces proteolyticus]KAH8692853.1 PXA domain protein [Talaromyces proteolyticus]
MTTNIPRRGLSPSNPAPTNVNLRTSSSSQSSYQPMRAAPRAVYRKNAPDNESSDASNDKNAVALIRRVLCSDSSYGSNTPRPLQDLLPPLTSSNDVDLQLYALIAIIVKEFVYSWYAKITPDHVFIDEVLQLIAHCTRALEQRLRQVDVKQLVLDEIPGLVEAHIIAYRTASQGSSLVSIPSSTRDIYHQLNPHPGLSPSPDPLSASAHPEKEENERLYRHLLAQGVLAVLLPTEDLENVCLRTLVEDILSDLLLGNEVSGKICEGWFIWTAVSKIIETVRRRNIETSKTTRPSNKGGLGRLEKFGLLSNDQHDDGLRAKSQSAMSLWMWKMLYAAYLFYLVVRFVVGGLFHTALSPAEPPTRETASTEQLNPVKPIQAPPSRPVLDYQAFSLLSQWSGLPLRMPWLSGSFSLIQTLVLTGPGKLGEANSVIDR